MIFFKSLSIIFSAVLYHYATASHILFQAEPSTYTPGASAPMLVVRCSVEDAKPLPDLVVGKRDDAPTTEPEVTDAMSIHIRKYNPSTQRDEALAKLNYGQDPVLTPAGSDVTKVEGATETSPVGGEVGYLQLTWDNPTEQQYGKYSCEINGVTSEFIPFTFTETVEVGPETTAASST